MPEDARNLVESASLVARADRERLLGQRGAVLWFTGLSGSGKSAIARLLERSLLGAGRAAYVLDGDNLRLGLNRDLGFSDADRSENIRRAGAAAALLADAGLLAIAALISPFRADRAVARAAAEKIGAPFLEIYCAAPLATCEARDPKGLYKKARAGEIADFTGITSVYEPPERPEIPLATDRGTPAERADEILSALAARGILPPAVPGAVR